MPALPLRALAENLRTLVAKENRRLADAWRKRLHQLALTCEPWAVHAISRNTAPSIRTFRVEIPCYERLPLRHVFNRQHVYPASYCLTLGSPGLVRKWFKLSRPNMLCMEICCIEATTRLRVFLANGEVSVSPETAQGV